jgi:hypothetical protein
MGRDLFVISFQASTELLMERTIVDMGRDLVVIACQASHQEITPIMHTNNLEMSHSGRWEARECLGCSVPSNRHGHNDTNYFFALKLPQNLRVNPVPLRFFWQPHVRRSPR